MKSLRFFLFYGNLIDTLSVHGEYRTNVGAGIDAVAQSRDGAEPRKQITGKGVVFFGRGAFNII